MEKIKKIFEESWFMKRYVVSDAFIAYMLFSFLYQAVSVNMWLHPFGYFFDRLFNMLVCAGIIIYLNAACCTNLIFQKDGWEIDFLYYKAQYYGLLFLGAIWGFSYLAETFFDTQIYLLAVFLVLCFALAPIFWLKNAYYLAKWVAGTVLRFAFEYKAAKEIGKEYDRGRINIITAIDAVDGARIISGWMKPETDFDFSYKDENGQKYLCFGKDGLTNDKLTAFKERSEFYIGRIFAIFAAVALCILLWRGFGIVTYEQMLDRAEENSRWATVEALEMQSQGKHEWEFLDISANHAEKFYCDTESLVLDKSAHIVGMLMKHKAENGEEELFLCYLQFPEKRFIAVFEGQEKYPVAEEVVGGTVIDSLYQVMGKRFDLLNEGKTNTSLDSFYETVLRNQVKRMVHQ